MKQFVVMLALSAYVAQAGQLLETQEETQLDVEVAPVSEAIVEVKKEEVAEVSADEHSEVEDPEEFTVDND